MYKIQPNIMQSTSEHICQNTGTQFSTESTSSDDTTPAQSNISLYNTPTVDAHASSTTLAINSHALDTDTFPAYGTYLLPSEPNGTWRAHASHLFKNSQGTPSTFCKVMELHTQELDISDVRGKLEHIAEDRKDQMNNWLNQTFAEYDLVEMHGQVQRLIPSVTMPKLRHLDTAIDTVSDIAQNLCHFADHALMEQGISSEEESTCRLQSSEHCGRALEFDLDPRHQVVEDDWQLLEL
jgi:hypothetical protein